MFEKINQKKTILDAIIAFSQTEMLDIKAKLELDFIYFSNSVDEYVDGSKYKLALAYINKLVLANIKLTASQIQQLYFIITNKKLDINKDKIINLVSYYELEGKYLHPIERVVYLYSMIMKIIGDVRLARLVVNLELMKKGYPLIVIKNDEQGIYQNIKNAVEESLDLYLTVI